MALLLNFQTLLRLPNTASRRPPGENGGDKNSPRSQERAKAPRRRKSGKRQKEQTIWVVGWALKNEGPMPFERGDDEQRAEINHEGADMPNSTAILAWTLWLGPPQFKNFET